MPDETQAPQTPKFERTPNFVSSYANSAIFEASAWDLKIIFGQLDQSPGSVEVKQHLAVTIPWAQAKLALYWLRVQVEAMELQSGKIPIRRDLVPPEPPQLTAEQENDPQAKQLRDLVVKIREDFIANL
jgi:Protein of unknown function (DUF3467)